MEIVFPKQHIYFLLFYFLAFTFLAIVVIGIGRRQNYSYRTLLLFLGTITLSTILGSRLVTIPFDVWPDLIFAKDIPYFDRAAVGGLVFGTLALWISQKALKLSNKFMVHFVWILPLGFAIQKVGCFINGCCHGIVCNNFLGVRYPRNTIAHYNQWDFGYIPIEATLTRPVYPVQLFEIVVLVGIAIVGWHLRKKWKNPWATLLLVLCFIFGARFGLEFFRDPISSQFGTIEFFGLRKIQWTLLLLSGISLLLFYSMEKIESMGIRLPKISPLYLFSILTSCAIAFHGVFLNFEWWVLWITLFPALGLFVYHYGSSRVSLQRWGWVTIGLVTPIIVIAQTVDTIQTDIKKFNEVTVGVNSGTFYNLLLFNPQTQTTGGGCIIPPITTTTYSEELFKHEYTAFGAGYTRVERSDNKQTRWGINGYWGTIDSYVISTNDKESNSYWGVNPYVQYDKVWWGLGAGLNAGNFYVNKEDKIKEQDLSNTIEKRVIWPSFYARVGHRKYLDLIYRYGNTFPTSYPTTFHEISIGSGLLQNYDYGLRYGTFFPGGQFIAAEGIFDDRLGINFMYIFKDDYNFDLPENKSSKFLVSLKYRFGSKSIK